MAAMLSMRAIIFLAAFLLFQIELIVSKMLLPQFGGAYFVWGGAVVFFQATLLGGYLYSHVVVRWLGVARYRYIHLALLCLPLFVFPGRPLTGFHGLGHMPLMIGIFVELAGTVGLVFFVLSTTSIIFQSWLAASRLPARSNPYVLFGVSNLGSFAALVSYPFFFEPFFDLGMQLKMWRLAYVVLVALHVVAVRLVGVYGGPAARNEPSHPVSKHQAAYWFLLSASTVILFLSVTNIVTYEVTPMPLLWIMPLGIYLLSFVLNFKKKPWCPRWIERKFYLLLEGSIIFYLMSGKKYFPFLGILSGLLFFLFTLCMFSHKKLYDAKPAAAGTLTMFYLVISLGGFLGGIFVSWVAPLVHSNISMFEYIVGLVCITMALTIDQRDYRIGFEGIWWVVCCSLLFMILPLSFLGYKLLGLAAAAACINFIFSKFKARAGVLNLIACAVIMILPVIDRHWLSSKPVYVYRNYYGIYKVADSRETRVLSHGNTVHGIQYFAQGKKYEPSGYYHPITPVGMVLSLQSSTLKHIGVLGLGTATLAAYAQKGQEMDFFELDPAVVRIASQNFEYLKHCPAKVTIMVGDGRLSLKQIPDKRYDLLIIDAFAGDSVPVNLLTTEAIAEYKRCLNDKGILLFHISNTYVDLYPVIYSTAKALGAYVGYDSNPLTQGQILAFASEWALVTWDAQVFRAVTFKLGWFDRPIGWKSNLLVRPWTDTYSNTLQVVKFRDILVDTGNKLLSW